MTSPQQHQHQAQLPASNAETGDAEKSPSSPTTSTTKTKDLEDPQDLAWVFHQLDPNGTGFIPVKAFYEFATRDRPSNPHVAHTAAYIMGIFAKTRPEHLTLAELADYVRLCKNGTREDQYRVIFRDAARRRPGLLSRDELADLIREKYGQLLKPDFDDVFDNCDEDTDGWLTDDEFVRFVDVYEL